MKITSAITGRGALAALLCIPPAAALAFAGGLAVVTAASPARAEGATDCLDLIDGSLFNSCPFTVSAVWCVENLDCNGGRYTNMSNIPSLQGNLVHGGRSGNMVRWAACRGVNTITHHGTAAYSWEHYCSD